MIYVYSTLGQNMIYTNFVNAGSDLKVPNEEIFIKGGAQVIDNRTLITSLGVRTEITEQQHEMLKRNETFKRHVKNGFIVVQDNKQKVEKVVNEHMEPKDKSAQMTHKDFEELRKKGQPGNIPAEIHDKKKVSNGNS